MKANFLFRRYSSFNTRVWVKLHLILGTNNNFYQPPNLSQSQLSLQPAESSPQGAPSMYQFVGTNDAKCDDNSNWMILCEDLSDRPWRSYYEVRYCKVQRELSGQKFRCLGIRVLNNRRSNGWTSIRNIRMWMRIDGAKDEL